MEKKVRNEARRHGVRLEVDAHEIVALAPKGKVFGCTEATVMVAEKWEHLAGRLYVVDPR